MTNLEKYNQAFLESFDVDTSVLPNLTYQSISNWDSVGHMGLMAKLEETFGIIFETDDIVDFSSFQKGKEIVKKYGVAL
jgi:acyl carrier protein